MSTHFGNPTLRYIVVKLALPFAGLFVVIRDQTDNNNGAFQCYVWLMDFAQIYTTNSFRQSTALCRLVLDAINVQNCKPAIFDGCKNVDICRFLVTRCFKFQYFANLRKELKTMYYTISCLK